ncbi:SusC/RagA family TonB-linked outer membrane protein [Negadavirga shengliensis]|uniref:SusC/RagA family TonB-linked outer membrane protein n=1 Tax=Negadavirga shengliensis TaxID=1389218 RepID=A0ABV9T3B3_9BACT
MLSKNLQLTIFFTVLFFFPAILLLAQERNIQGKVNDESGDAIPGATVLVKGTNRGTATDIDGSFEILVSSPSDVLAISYVGYISREIEVGNQSEFTITLQPDMEALSEVVVVGYGTQRRRDVTGAVASVQPENIRDLPMQGIDQAMAGQIAGVRAQQTTGTPGGGINVQIRGTGSISAGGQPLYVIDGFPVSHSFSQQTNPLAALDPNDIESLEVLKDASAAAIYGSRGANGVVLITTKRGKTGKPTINVDMYSGVQEVQRRIEMMDPVPFTEMLIAARNNSYLQAGGNSIHDSNVDRLIPGAGDYFDNYLIPELYSDFLANPDQYTYTNWQDHIFRTAPIHNFNISASGGTENTSYYISGGYFRQDGVVIESGFERYSLRANVETQVSNRVKIGMNINPTLGVHDLVNAEGNPWDNAVIMNALTIMPFIAPYNEDGSYGDQLTFGRGTAAQANPIAVAREIDNEQHRLRLLGNVYAEVAITDDLSFRTSVGTDMSMVRQSQFFSGAVRRYFSPSSGFVANFQRTNILNENTLSYDKSFDGHRFNAVVGFTSQYEYIENSQINANNYPNDLVKTINAGIIVGGDHLREEWSLLSYLARVNYAYKDKFLLTGTIRRDGSSRFGAQNKWGYFPSGSIGYRISEESFMNVIPVISDLKVRASYGVTGNFEIGNYAHIGLLGANNYALGAGTGNVVNGLLPTTLSNTGLGWERTRQYDFGLDIGLLEDRVIFAVDHYRSNTTDLLLNVPIPRSTGYANAFQNIGEVENKGWEFALLSRNSVGEFNWTTDFNLSWNRNKVLALGPGGDPIISGNHITRIGDAMGSHFGYLTEGIYQTMEEVNNTPHPPGTRPGDRIFIDVDGDGEMTPQDRTIIGNNQPDFMYGMTNRFNYKNFDFSFLIQGVQGAQVYSVLYERMADVRGQFNQMKISEGYWQSPENPGNGFTTRPFRDAFLWNERPGNWLIRDVSFLRINNVTLGYSLPPQILQTMFLERARVYIGVQNPYTFTSYEGFNPEVSTNGDNPLQPGVDRGGYPVPRTYLLGVNVSF